MGGMDVFTIVALSVLVAATVVFVILVWRETI